MPFIFYAKNSKYVEIFKAICHYVYKSVTIHGSLLAAFTNAGGGAVNSNQKGEERRFMHGRSSENREK
jgi:hypothetical protein